MRTRSAGEEMACGKRDSSEQEVAGKSVERLGERRRLRSEASTAVRNHASQALEPNERCRQAGGQSAAGWQGGGGDPDVAEGSLGKEKPEHDRSSSTNTPYATSPREPSLD